MKYAQAVLADLAPLLKLDPRLFQARMAVWQVMWAHERPCTNELAMRTLGWNQRGWFSARQALLDAGLIVQVVGGYSCPDAQPELLAWAEGQLEKVNAKLAKGTAPSGGRRLTATERGRLQREAERLADVPHQFKHQGELFGQGPLPKHSGNPDGKANENNASHSPAPARETDEEAPGEGQFGQSFGNVSANLRETYAKHSPNQPENPNNFNGSHSRTHARLVKVKEKDKRTPPVSPTDAPPKLVEGVLVEDDGAFTIPKRQPGRPIPDDWQPDTGRLSPAVLEMVEQWPPGELQREATKFIEDAHGNDRRHRNWDRALGVWLTKHDGYLQNRRQRDERPSGWRNRA